jgi:hypothetical protein
MDIKYKWVPHKWQLKCLNESKRFNVVVAHRRFGKSTLEVNKLILSALKAGHSGWEGVYIAPQLKQAEKISWKYFKEYSACVPGLKVSESRLRITYPNGATVQLYGANDPDSIRGVGLDGAVLDEVAQMPIELWEEIIRPALTERKGWCDFIGTPKGIDLFYDLYQKGLKEEDWTCHTFRASETGVIPADELGKIKRMMSPSKYAQEFECDFNASSEDTCIPLEICLAASKRSLPIHAYHRDVKTMGVDVGGAGGDKTVIYRRQGYMMFAPIRVANVDHMAIAGKIAHVIEEFKPDAVFIDQGHAVGLISRLKEMNYKVREVPFASAPSDERFLNKRAEMYHEFHEWLKEGGCIPNDQILIADLTAPIVETTSAGRIKLEEKKLIKQRLGRSPDDGDAAVLTVAHKVRRVNDNPMTIRGNYNNREYHVHERFRR